jgi:hypothetical protein
MAIGDLREFLSIKYKNKTLRSSGSSKAVLNK